jgi:glycosyltransferase involved in cell wall biosynthesis
MGWAIASGAVEAGHDVVLVTQPRNRTAVEGARRDDPMLADHLHPVYVGLPGPLMDAWSRYGRLRGLQFASMAWQLSLWRVVRRLHRQEPFDVAHHVTLSTDWVPTGLAWVCGLPFVWGPIGGGERVPRDCRRWLGLRGRLTEWTRRLTADPMRAIFGAVAARRAALLVAQNPDEARRWERTRLANPVAVRPNVFLADESEDRHDPGARTKPEGGVRTAVFVGRLLAWKGVRLAVSVMEDPRLADWDLHVYGDGPERRELARAARRPSLSGRLVMHGARPRAEVRAAMARADAFLFPSMREAGGWVVAEALEVGCPVVCLDVGGPSVLVGDVGRAVPPGPQVAGALAEALIDSARPGSARPVVRWDRSELPDLLDTWYRIAIGTNFANHRAGTAGASTVTSGDARSLR